LRMLRPYNTENGTLHYPTKSFDGSEGPEIFLSH
jgi:hypothetical protein